MKWRCIVEPQLTDLKINFSIKHISRFLTYTYVAFISIKTGNNTALSCFRTNHILYKYRLTLLTRHSYFSWNFLMRFLSTVLICYNLLINAYCVFFIISNHFANNVLFILQNGSTD